MQCNYDWIVPNTFKSREIIVISFANKKYEWKKLLNIHFLHRCSVAIWRDILVPPMLSKQWNHFCTCSASDEIVSTYAQQAMKLFSSMLSMRLDVHVKTAEIWTLAEHTQKFVWPILSVRWNCFCVCSVCDTIVSTMFSMRMFKFSKITQKCHIKMQNFDYK
jgi:hypothetical protein